MDDSSYWDDDGEENGCRYSDDYEGEGDIFA